VSRRHASIGLARRSGRISEFSAGVPGPSDLFDSAARVAWFEADAVSLNGGNVSSFTNLWGNGDATQGTAANQALFDATGFNGQNCVTGDGINDTYVATLVSQPPAGSRLYLWCVHQFVAAPAAVAMPMCVYPSGGVPATHMQVRGSNTTWFYNLNNTTEGAGPAIDTSRHLYECGHLSVTTAKFAFDGTTTNGANTNATATAATDRVRIFGNQAGASLANCRFKTAVLVVGEPTAAQIAAMRTWFRSRSLGITIA
jgi:hypothetical protein